MIKSLIFKLLNGRWYFAPAITVLFSLFCWLLLVILPVFPSTWITLNALPGIAAILSMLLGVWRIFKKEFKNGILQIFASFFVMGFLGFLFGTALPKSPYKKYTGNIKAPGNEQMHMPLMLAYDGEKPLQEVKQEDIILYDDNIPGQYRYEIFLNKIEKGEAYLRIFDLKTNRILSEKEVTKRSKIKVSNPAEDLREFGLSKNFRISEGSWGNYYGSRIELWFQPADPEQPERKLLTRYYVIQGN